MESRIDHLFQEWHKLGGAVLLARKNLAVHARHPEEVIAESTAHCRDSGRLTWVLLDWLIRHIEQVDEQKLLEETHRKGNLSVLAVLCDAANLRKPHPKFEYLMGFCLPNSKIEPFFNRVARSRLASRLAEENALQVFRKWNYLCRQLRYL